MEKVVALRNLLVATAQPFGPRHRRTTALRAGGGLEELHRHRRRPQGKAKPKRLTKADKAAIEFPPYI